MALVHESLPEGNTVRKIDRQDVNGRSTEWRQADQDRPVPAEMPVPLMAPRMEKLNDLPRYLIYF